MSTPPTTPAETEFSNKLTEHHVIAIHGVGTPAPDQVRSELAKNLAAGSIGAQVVEFNWNTISRQAFGGRDLSLTAIQDAAFCFARASCSMAPGQLATPWSPLSRSLEFVTQLLFQISEAVLAAWFITVCYLFPLLYLVHSIKLRTPSTQAIEFRFTSLLQGAAVVFLCLQLLFLLLSTALAFAASERSILWSAIRRIVILNVRPIFLVGVLPFLFPWRSVTRFAWRKLLVFLLLLSGLLSCEALIVYLWQRRHGNTFLFTDLFGLSAVKFLIFTTLILLASAWIVKSLIGPSLKVLLDIFRYVADQEYRGLLLHKLDTLISGIAPSQDGTRHLVIVAHSLGTVIAVDSLVRSECWKPNDHVSLFTLGSPLKRFFFRFFPNLLFPPNAFLCAQMMARRVARFRWMNCYRPWDQIGTAIGLPEVSGSYETSTRQYSRILTAHLNYWADARARAAIWEWSRKDEWFATAAPSMWSEVSFPAQSKFRDTLATALLVAAFACCLAVPVLVLVSSVRDWLDSADMVSNKVNRLQKEGIATQAMASCNHRVDIGPNYRFDSYTVTLVSLDRRGATNVVTKSTDFGKGFDNHDFEIIDFPRLCDFIKKSGREQTAVEIKYLPEDPTAILVPAFYWTPRVLLLG
jgi:hypothetical protein